ncbi:Coatomer subunit gamma [Trypanosoma equiperdum]|uniref:Coatomer subunit gamma n=4 Tax=Trypanozoon TaxID=39700 RepID=Q382Z1_TRYB2|nr:coatomer gamma subunit, putative [Trypanosoma brucei gambiense DAL972]XP_829252.1 coatomer subunit gamma [Trypanosoma brucei brucei TREU927]RHW68305.1 Coatomer subunit gamma [Trypanosoma brucei equiperdum]SCU65780.1 Coatomer subunit gamma [Trypanosoma equiperdum]EAN80140.1 coatomer gamma subunit, putative [Trypanosoma brucei brucei TREU927]CBH18216.1 coatomer gamma subunit, putative [Trypanosoma brucei gambiense DAL972]|eukprot:XP_011780480.1 coatomer gamma subunit, putative [Trypanosoma brucei gambiense DAL972]
MQHDRDRYDSEEDDEESLPFDGIEKASVLQQCRVFNDVQLDISACLRCLTECLYLIYTGTTFTEAEATELFFMSTKLLQSNRSRLRRLHYVLMKELSPFVEQSFIASNSLMGDTKSNNESNKRNGMRTLCKVMNPSLYPLLDRTIVESLTSRSEKVLLASLITGFHVALSHPDLARKWSTQLNEAIRVLGNTQYLTVAIMHIIRKSDRVTVKRFIEQVRNGVVRSPLALSFLVKLTTDVLQEGFEEDPEVKKYIATMRHSSSEIVVFDTLRCMCVAGNASPQQFALVASVAQIYLNAKTSVSRFCAIRVLHDLAAIYPDAVTPISSDIEQLIMDQNRFTASFAMLTLLKTGTEASVERLIGALGSVGQLRELPDEFKVAITLELRSVSARFPQRYNLFLGFLVKLLSDDGSSTFKESIVEVITSVAKANDGAREAALKHLVDYVEDCAHVSILHRVHMYLGDEVPRSENPALFIRYINNHAALEFPEVRAAAVSTFARIAARVPSLRRSILPLLKHKCSDEDDEVRDRAIMYTKVFLLGDEDVIHSMVTEVSNTVAARRKLITPMTPTPLLEPVKRRMCQADHSTVAVETGIGKEAAHSSSGGGSVPGNQYSSAISEGRAKLLKIKQLQELGEPRASSEPVPLSDPDSEYFVTLIKHVYVAHVVLQFRVKNTMDSVVFRRVTVEMDTEELDAEPLYAIPISAIEPGATEYAYAVLQYSEGRYPSGTLGCRIKFALQERDGSSVAGEGEEEYPLEDFEVNVSDFITPIDLGECFQQKWEELRQEETCGTYALSSMRNLTAAAHELVEFFGMHVVGGKVDKITAASHTLLMSGSMVDGASSLVMINARLFIATDNTVALQLTLRGGSSELREYLSGALLS